jgi:hypothetical protein
MAEEISVTIAVTVNNSGFVDDFNSGRLTFTQVAVGADAGTVSVTTSEGNLSLANLTTNGFLILKNLDSTNFIDYGLDDSGTMKACGRLLAGEVNFIRVKPATSVRLKADTATCKLRYWALNA